jgi:hypothetical protein
MGKREESEAQLVGHEKISQSPRFATGPDRSHILQLHPLSLAAMAKPRGAPPLLHPRPHRLLRSPISRCACLLLAFAALLLLSSLHQVVRVDLSRLDPAPPRQARFAIPPSPFWLLVACCCLLRFHCASWCARRRCLVQCGC